MTPEPRFSDVARNRIDDVVHVADSAQDLLAYFRIDGPAKDRYSGAWFERLAGGGDRAEAANQIDANDLVAVTMLSVQVPPLVAAELLHGEMGRDVSKLLTEVPAKTSLRAASDQHIGDGSAASRVWALLEGQPGMGWVTAGKLLARKRPHLIPVYDNVTRCLLDEPDGHVWERFRNELADNSTGLSARLEELHSTAGLPEAVSSLRVLDVLLWMAHHKQHQAPGACWN